MNCQRGLNLGEGDNSLDDEVLREIMEEEAAKKKEDTKRKNIGKKKKNKKKKKKAAVKEDLSECEIRCGEGPGGSILSLCWILCPRGAPFKPGRPCLPLYGQTYET